MAVNNHTLTSTDTDTLAGFHCNLLKRAKSLDFYLTFAVKSLLNHFKHDGSKLVGLLR